MLASAYLFLLGLAAGVSLLTMSAFRRVTPAWLKWMLLASGVLVIGRYVAMAMFATAAQPHMVWGWRFCWFATSLALPLQTAFAIDQLVRHPAMTPKRVLMWLSPWLAAYLAVILFGHVTAAPDRIAGWGLHLTPGWQRLLAAAHSAFVLAVLALAWRLVPRLPSTAVRLALLGLAAAQVALAADGMLVGLGYWYVRPYLWSELLALTAVWHAFNTAERAPF